MRLQKKSLSRVTLVNLLKRRRSNLETFLTNSGIVTYDLLVSRCNSMGVVPPTYEEFMEAKGNPSLHDVSSPTEGIVVMNPPAEDTELSQTAAEQSPRKDTVVTVSLNESSLETNVEDSRPSKTKKNKK